MKTLVLASASPRRKELLSRAGIPFIVDVGEYEEDLSLNLAPHELVKHLALGKAKAVCQRHQNSVIIGADTIVVLGDELFGKPHTPDRAKEMLRRISGNMNTVVTGYALIDTASGEVVTESQETKIFFRTMSEHEIDAYIATGEPLDKAGGYAIQGIGGIFIEKIHGDWNSALGLPLYSVMQTLQQFGIDPFIAH